MSDATDPTLHPDRQLPFEGAFNFRDLGGYATRTGRTVRWRTLFRADAVHRLPDAELDVLGEIGVRTILDLRTNDEVEKGHLADESRGLTHLHLPVLGETWEPRDLPDDADASEVLGTLYIDMLTIGAPALRGALTTIADADHLPAVFHCAAGKDRTGVLAAMVLSLLDVDDDTIVADYSISGRSMDALVDRLRRDRPDALTTMNEQPSAYLAAPPAAMRRFLSHVTNEFGSMRGYAESLGLASDLVDELRSRLLD